jgi:hypothetical protein
MASSAAKSAAATQAEAAEKAGDTSLEVAKLQIGAQDTALNKTFAAN